MRYVPATLNDFYESCKSHFYNEYLLLLSGYLANIERAKKLDDVNKAGNLLKFFELRLTAISTLANTKYYEIMLQRPNAG
jgi:hypothetical protein